MNLCFLVIKGKKAKNGIKKKEEWKRRKEIQKVGKKSGKGECKIQMKKKQKRALKFFGETCGG